MASYVVMEPPDGRAQMRTRFSCATAFVARVSVPAFWLLWHRLWIEAALLFAAIVWLDRRRRDGRRRARRPAPLAIASCCRSIRAGGPALRIARCAGAAGAMRAWSRPIRCRRSRNPLRLSHRRTLTEPGLLAAGCHPARFHAAPVARRRGARPAVLSGIALTMRVAIIDYGSGNLRSATKAFERAAREAGIAAEIDLTADAERVRTADRIVLPGVGAYADCRAGLDAVPGMWKRSRKSRSARAGPFPRHLRRHAADVGARAGKDRHQRLGWIAGDVKEIEPSDPALKIPQIGWNTLDAGAAHPLFDGIPTGPDGLHAYFVHSYHLDATKARTGAGDGPTMAGRSPPPSRATTSPARSSIPKRARRSAWP
jgi:glutamine amidotransferase